MSKLTHGQQDFKESLLISFHDQFAENQNHHQQSFIQVLSVLLTVLIGYGYVFTNGGKLDVKDLVVSDFLLEIAFCIASLINCFGLLLILNNAHGFRRDQFVVSRIRAKVGLINISSSNNSDYIFPAKYDPADSYSKKVDAWHKYLKEPTLKKWSIVFKWFHFSVAWMPNFYNILLFVLGELHFLLLASFLLNPYDSFTLKFASSKGFHWHHFLATLLWLGTALYVVNRIRHFKAELERLYKS